MTDLLHTLPNFPTKHYTHLIPSLEKSLITTTDLLTLDPLEVAKRAHLPLLDVRRLANHVLATLQSQLGVIDGAEALRKHEESPNLEDASSLKASGRTISKGWSAISTLDPLLDAALGGGIPTTYITEVTGERYFDTRALKYTKTKSIYPVAGQAKLNSSSLSFSQPNSLHHRALPARPSTFPPNILSQPPASPNSSAATPTSPRYPRPPNLP